MAMSDIQRLRQQYVFNPVQDITGGGMNMSGMGYAPRPGMGGYNPPPIADEGPQRDPFGLGQPSTGPTFPDMGVQPIRPPQTVTPGSNVDPNQSSLQATIDAINRVYTPENVERDRVRALLDKPPERGAPSFARSLVAAGLSLKAEDPVATAEKVQYAPYYRDVESFKTKAEPFLKAWDLENRGNINERTLAGNVVTAQTQADRLASQERIANQKNETALIRARAYAYSQSLGKGWDWDLTGPTAKKFNKTTGEVIDTGLETGKMDEQTKIELQNEGRVAAAREQGINAMNRAQVGGQGLIVVEGKTYRYNPDSGQYEPAPGLPTGTPTRPGVPRAPTAGAKTNTLEDRRIIQDRMKIQFETDPIARQFITKGTNGIYSMKTRPVVGADKPGLWTGDYTQEEVDAWDRIKAESDPTYKPPAETKGIGPGGTTPNKPSEGGRGGGPGLGPTTAPGGGRGGGGDRGGGPAGEQKTITKREYSPSRNQTRITYSDGTTQMLPGKQ